MPINRGPIPVWLVEEEVGGGLPPARAYSASHLGPPIGHVALPPTYRLDRYADHVVISEDRPGRPYPEHVASLGINRLVGAAVAGEFGLAWRPGPPPAPCPICGAAAKICPERDDDELVYVTCPDDGCPFEPSWHEDGAGASEAWNRSVAEYRAARHGGPP